MSKSMTLRMEDEQAATLEMLARADGQSMSDTVRTALDAHIAQRRADAEFQARLARIKAEDQEILERLAK
jgi:hypothetical protein